MPPSRRVGPATAEQVVDIDPLLIYFTFSRIRPRFSCGRTIGSTLQQFRDGELQLRDLPLLSVLTDGAHYYSQNNRRLYTYKQLKREGLLDTVPVRLRPLPRTKRMYSKYSPQTCALAATLMRDTANRDGIRDTSAQASVVSDASDTEDDHDNHDACMPTGAVGKLGVGDDEFRSDNHSAPSSSAPSQPASCAMESGLDGKMVKGRDSSEEPTRKRQEQQTNSKRGRNVSRRQGCHKGAVEARSPSTSSSDSCGNGSTSALEAELRNLGLCT
ncbi:hypothetical protein NXY56_006963 [Leishmania guyanensis]|uniref:Uncharacterized protein n=1 Tax=Leishmania guyanensis TaxID=5670 RepID=A0A1E1IVE2_LEIGU|nr:hypothetical protein, conserved [Leishmania guyanensis]